MHWLKACTAAAWLLCLMTVSAQAIDPAPAQPAPTQPTSSRAPAANPSPSGRAATDRATPGEWWIQGNDNAAVFADQTTRTILQNGIRRMWTTWVFRYPENQRRYNSVLFEGDCTQRRYRMLSLTGYTATGVSLGTDSRPTEYQYLVPGSLGDGVLDLMCSPFSSWSGSVRVPESYTPVLFADQVAWFDETATGAQSCAPRMQYQLALGAEYSLALAEFQQCQSQSQSQK